MTEQQPELITERLRLRPFTLDDALDVRRLAGDRAIADTTTNIPHPYEEGMAEEWIAAHAPQFEKGAAATFAITSRQDGRLIGAIGLTIRTERQAAEMGYWIGRPYWGQGYATEAAQAILAYGFADLGLNRIYASYLTRNPASGRVMEKIGMSYEGTFRQHIRKWEQFEDLAFRAILREEWAR